VCALNIANGCATTEGNNGLRILECPELFKNSPLYEKNPKQSSEVPFFFLATELSWQIIPL
jgi:hypothetical protein